MNTLNEQQIQTHVPIAAILLIASNALYLLGAVVLFFVMVIVSGMLSAIGISSGDAEAARVLPQISGLLGMLGVGFAMFLAILALPGLIAGIGLLMRKSWARILGIVVGVLMLFHFPLGTLIGAYTIFVLAQDAAPNYLETPQPRVETKLQPATGLR
jgi:hypothetical protein